MLKQILMIALIITLSGSSAKAALVISGVMDGPLSGGTPKAVELFATTDIADLSVYTLDYYFNANATPSTSASLSGSLTAGDYYYVTPNETEFSTWFGFANDLTGGGSVNGDDSLVLLNSGTVESTFGVPGTDGSGEPWDYLDGWAYRNNNTTSTSFVLSEWTFSGINALDGETTNSTAASPVPFGTFEAVSAVPEPSTTIALALGGLVGGIQLRRRRRIVAA
ncbi:PEP-CTERM sorting domain-containing protein [Rubripirellula amarantea]|nr:PEP-CTERM sorting domain-containing protein [Rubripirellula amarantea]